jgi:hypothetical protein
VSRVLGHSQISTTSDIYGLLVPEMTARATAKMDVPLKPAKKGLRVLDATAGASART